MTIKNDWLTTSLSERTAQNLCDFSLTIKPYPFISASFKENSKRVAREIYNQNQNIYIFYSGGLDSEYVLKTFLDENIPVTPVTITTPYNKKELEHAVKFYTERNIKPLIFNYEKYEMFNIMRKKCLEKGYYSFAVGLQLHVCDIITDKGGVVINGFGDPIETFNNPLNSKNLNELNLTEWDFYIEYHFGKHINGFFTYDLALHYSILQDVVFDVDPNLMKSNLYQLPYRKKQPADPEFWQIFNQLKLNIPKYSVKMPYQQYLNALTATESTTFT